MATWASPGYRGSWALRAPWGRWGHWGQVALMAAQGDVDKQEQKGTVERWDPGEPWGHPDSRVPRVGRGSGGTKAQMVLLALLDDLEFLELEA